MAVAELESVTVTVKSKEPVAVGTPDSMPVAACSARPVGRRARVTDHEYGGVPPDAVESLGVGTLCGGGRE
ncbi:MAG: hypothetical protein WDO73_03970 [Ignavibacteriota bacterium]